MTNKFIWLIIAVVVLAGGYFVYNQNPASDAGPNGEGEVIAEPQANNQESSQPVDGEEPAGPATVIISMTTDGFVPSTATIAKGDIVTFVNNDSSPHWPASAPHPTHTDYPGFDALRAVVVGESWSFTFDLAGTWRFHDHLKPTMFGSITVTE
jgi:plastocyanin